MTSSFSLNHLEQAITQNLLIISGEASVHDLVQLMNQAHDQASILSKQLGARSRLSKSCTSCVLVVSESRLVGILTLSDLMRIMLRNLDIKEIKVSVVMTQPVVTMRRSEFQEVITPLNLLRQHHLSYLPLLDEHDYPIGLVTLKGLFQTDDFKMQPSQAQQIEDQSLLLAIAKRIQASLDLQTILETTVQEIRQFLKTDRVIAYRFDADWSGVVVAESVAYKCNSLLGRVLTRSHFGKAMVTSYENGRIQVTDNIYLGLSECHTKFLEQLQVQAIIVVPILQEGQLWGLLAAQECTQSRFWDRSSVVLLQQLSTHISIAIQQAKTMSQLQLLNQELEGRILERTTALVNSENRLNLIVSNISDGILIVDQEGQIVFANPSAGMTFGMPVEQLIGLIIGIPNVLNNQVEISLLSHDGRIGESEMQVVPIKWNNHPAYLISLHDITERQQAELKLLKSQADLAEAQQIAHVGSWELDIVTQKISWSDEMYQIFGLAHHQVELTYEQIPQYISPRDWDILGLLINRAVQFGEPYEVDLQIIRADGSTGYIFAKGTPKHDAEGGVRYLFGTAMDISDRKVKEAMLRKYERVVAATTDGIILYDHKYVYQLVNHVYLDWHNKSQEEIIGHSVIEFLGGNFSQANIQTRLDRCLAGEVQRYEDWFDYQDGNRRFVRVTYSPYSEIDGSITGVLASLHDLTALKQTEESLRKSEFQLQLTNEELSRATRMKDEFLANMSHELRTPLNSILGMTEGLQEGIFGSVNEQQIKALQTVERSGNHLLELINDILDVAKIESGQIELEYTSVPVSYLCQSSITFIKQQAMKKRIQLEVKLPQNLPNLLVDERRIRQVLINLLNNAVKFTPEGGRITLEVTQLPAKLSVPDFTPQQFLRIAVIDTGIGIAAENMKKLFQPFIQIDSALNRKYNGTGLGLALVKSMVELHGGKVGLTSELGVGSCFMIDLPYTSDLLEIMIGNQLSTTPTLKSPLTNQAISTPLILMAEDNEANIITVSSYLEAKGYRLLVAKNGEEAIALAKTNQPDLILMDIQMPVIDGLEAIKQIRLDPKLIDIPIIALTALAMAGDQERCLAAGANDYLAKPVKLKQLASTIQQVLAVSHEDK